MLGLFAAIAVLLAIAWMYGAAIRAAHGKLFADPRSVPVTPAAMVLGTSPRSDGRENPYFRYRINAAAALWKAGKVRTIIVSGDKDVSAHYDEPAKMRTALVKLGVPAERIVKHGAGFSTLDSVVHAKETFGLTRVVFVSQKFHNERAIYLAEANGIEAYGLNARDVSTGAGLPTRIREIQARVKMWLDVNVLQTRPVNQSRKRVLPR